MLRKIDRRDFLNTTLILGAGNIMSPYGFINPSDAKSKGFFTVAIKNGRWWLVTPEGEYTFSIGLNHIDPASIRFLASKEIWESKYSPTFHTLNRYR